jgi:hypothetical protein
LADPELADAIAMLYGVNDPDADGAPLGEGAGDNAGAEVAMPGGILQGLADDEIRGAVEAAMAGQPGAGVGEGGANAALAVMAGQAAAGVGRAGQAKPIGGIAQAIKDRRAGAGGMSVGVGPPAAQRVANLSPVQIYVRAQRRAQWLEEKRKEEAAARNIAF